jgi:hypothetical protein
VLAYLSGLPIPHMQLPLPVSTHDELGIGAKSNLTCVSGVCMPAEHFLSELPDL